MVSDNDLTSAIQSISATQCLKAQLKERPSTLISNDRRIKMTPDFKQVGKKTLKFLQEQFGFNLWMITRTEGDDLIVLSSNEQADDALHYGINEGEVLKWHDTICARMTAGEGPRVAPQVSLIPSYQSAPINQVMGIGAYIGVPLTNEDGSLFGTLCAFNPTTAVEEITEAQPIIEMMAGLLSCVLIAELKAQDALRRAERAETDATRDGLTGLYNRLGWSRLLAKEENRCARYGAPACVFNIDLDNLKTINDNQGHAAGDALLMKAADALIEATRTSDVVARLGGDEFCVLGIECDYKFARVIEKRIRKCLAKAGVEASVGLAMRNPGQGLIVACAEADEKMYIEKQHKKFGRLALAA